MTELVVGRCANCGGVTGEIVDNTNALTKTYCPNCEPHMYNPTRAHIRLDGTNPFAEGVFATILGDVDNLQDRAPDMQQVTEEGRCPHCGSTEFEWTGEATYLETRRVRYTARFWGTMDTNGLPIYDEIETEDTLEDWHEESELTDTRQTPTAVMCAGCGRSIQLREV